MATMNIAQMNGAPMLLKLPHDDETQGTQDFDAAARLIVKEWLVGQERRHGGTTRGVPGAIDWLTRVSYQVIKHLLDEDLTVLIDHRIERFGRRTVTGLEGVKLFQRGLMAIFAHEKHAITASVQERVSKRCWHAYRHYVPPAFIPGFFRQIESRGLMERAAENRIETQFVQWIIEQCVVEVEATDFRGRYPPEIEKEVERLERVRADKMAENVSIGDEKYEDRWD